MSLNRTEGAAEGPSVLRLVLDTSVFTNPDTARQFGPTPAAALAAFLDVARLTERRAALLMPPSIYAELQGFLGDTPVPALFEALVSLRAPNRWSISVPGFLLYELIDDIRGRIDRGLRVAERAVRDTHPENVEHTISKLRDRYREALRAGLLDSREDVDLILLALEQDGALVSSDLGVVRWAERMGVRLVHPHKLRELLESMTGGEAAPPEVPA